MNEQTYTEHLQALIEAWLEARGDYAAWWQAVSEANAYLVKGGAS